MATVAISSCDEDTRTLGNSLTSDVDRFATVTDTFNVKTRSLKCDSILSRSNYCYLGKIKDPETGSYITCDFMAQFNVLEKEASSLFPPKDSIISRDDNGNVVADSCFVTIMVNSFQGDSLAAMKVNLYEFKEPVTEKRTYYSNFDPLERGLLRTDLGCVQQNKMYSVSDLTQSDSMRAVLSTKNYYQYVDIGLNKPYLDKAGNEYNNYGTYIMRKYYEDPSKFKNANSFVRNICPGFYFKSSDGSGNMLEVAYVQLNVYYTYKNGTGYTYSTQRTFSSTQEVLRTTHIQNDKENIQSLVNVDTCTYLKTPAGIFTEVTLPVWDVKMKTDSKGMTHENDTITSASITFQRMRDFNDLSETLLQQPTDLLLVDRDSLYTFFENNQTTNNISSYLATYSSSAKTYTFYNIANMINRMWARRNDDNPNWNKAVLIPVEVTTTTSNSTTTVSNIANKMSISSVRLVGGDNNRHKPVQLCVVYSKND